MAAIQAHALALAVKEFLSFLPSAKESVLPDVIVRAHHSEVCGRVPEWIFRAGNAADR